MSQVGAFLGADGSHGGTSVGRVGFLQHAVAGIVVENRATTVALADVKRNGGIGYRARASW